MPSAQVKSCILLAGLYAQGQTSVTECGITRDHTERLLQHFRYPIERKADTVYLKGGGKLYATQVSIPGDLSSAAFFLVAASIIPGSYLTLRQVGINPTRTGIIHLLKEMGADITVHAVADAPESIADITVRYAALRGITIAPEWVPLAIDELPILLIAAACAKGVTTLRGAAELRVKESDRIEAMVQGLQRLGIRAQALPDGAMVEGGHFQGGEVDSYDDHRIAMSFAVAASVAQDSVTIRGCDHVGTSFPNFVALGNTAGMRITVYG